LAAMARTLPGKSVAGPVATDAVNGSTPAWEAGSNVTAVPELPPTTAIPPAISAAMSMTAPADTAMATQSLLVHGGLFAMSLPVLALSDAPRSRASRDAA